MFEYFRLVVVLIGLFFKISFCFETEVEKDKNIIVQDTCNAETFKPECPNGEDAVLLVSATYGRMEIGKCIAQEEVSGVLGQDPKYFGCSSDVLDVLHGKCSLKRTCEIKIPNPDVDKTKPCFPGLKSYLHAEYKCINVVEQDSSCRITATESPKYLTFNWLENSPACGLEPNGWIIEAPRGQKVKLTLENLNKHQNHVSNRDCGFEIGQVVDHSQSIAAFNTTLCSHGSILKSRENRLDGSTFQNVYVSIGSLIEVNFRKNPKDNKENDIMLLLKIETEGCLDIIPPEDTWLKRNNDDIVIGCYSSKKTWYLRCEKRKWNGVVGNCSIGQSAVDSNDEKHISRKGENIENVTEEQQIILFIAICALGLVICLTIVCVGAICMKKMSGKSGAANVYNKQPMYYPSGQYSMNRQTLTANQQKSTYAYPENFANQNIPDVTGKSDENKYFVLEDDQTEA